MKLERAFLALAFPHQMAAMIAAALDHEAWASELKRQTAADYHLTLHFLGDMAWQSEHSSVMTELASACPPLTYHVTGTGVFTHPRSMTLWLAAAGPGLPELHARTAEALKRIEKEPENRPFVPHITVARSRKVADDLQRRFKAWPLPPTTPIESHEMLLMARNPDPRSANRYQVVERFPYKEIKPSI